MALRTSEISSMEGLPSIKVVHRAAGPGDSASMAPKAKFSWGQFSKRKNSLSPSVSPRASLREAGGGSESPRVSKRQLTEKNKSPPKSSKSFFSSKTQIKAVRGCFLVNVTVLGSPGPLRIIVDDDASVERVIEKALREYARAGRLPVLGTDSKQFDLYCSSFDSEALEKAEEIGKLGARQFVLFRKKQTVVAPPVQHPPKTRWWNMMKGSKAVTSY